MAGGRVGVGSFGAGNGYESLEDPGNIPDGILNVVIILRPCVDPPSKTDYNQKQAILPTVGERTPVLVLGGVLLHEWPAGSVSPCWLDRRPPPYPLFLEILD